MSFECKFKTKRTITGNKYTIEPTKLKLVGSWCTEFEQPGLTWFYEQCENGLGFTGIVIRAKCMRVDLSIPTDAYRMIRSSMRTKM